MNERKNQKKEEKYFSKNMLRENDGCRRNKENSPLYNL